jgi:hypothetical protein
VAGLEFGGGLSVACRRLIEACEPLVIDET